MNISKIKIYKDFIDNGGEISITLNDEEKSLDAFIIENEELKSMKINHFRTLYGVVIDYLTREINLYGEEKDLIDLKLLHEKNNIIENIELLDKYLKVVVNLKKGGK